MYHYRCPGQKPTSGSIEAGVYVIDVSPRCVFDGTQWMLQGMSIANINFTYDLPPPKPLNLTWFIFPVLTNEIMAPHFSPGVKSVDLPSFHRLETLARPIEEGLQLSTPHPWWVWAVVAALVLVVAAMTGRFVQKTMMGRCRLRQPSATSTQKPQAKVVAFVNKECHIRDEAPEPMPALHLNTPHSPGGPPLRGIGRSTRHIQTRDFAVPPGGGFRRSDRASAHSSPAMRDMATFADFEDDWSN